MSKTGAPVYRIIVDRSGKKSVVPVKVKKCYKWQDTIFQNCVDGLRTFLNIRLSKYHVDEFTEDVEQKTGALRYRQFSTISMHKLLFFLCLAHFCL